MSDCVEFGQVCEKVKGYLNPEETKVVTKVYARMLTAITQARTETRETANRDLYDDLEVPGMKGIFGSEKWCVFSTINDVWCICYDSTFLLEGNNILKYSENAVKITLKKNNNIWYEKGLSVPKHPLDNEFGNCAPNKELDDHFSKYIDGYLICNDREELAREISYLRKLL